MVPELEKSLCGNHIYSPLWNCMGHKSRPVDKSDLHDAGKCSNFHVWALHFGCITISSRDKEIPSFPAAKARRTMDTKHACKCRPFYLKKEPTSWGLLQHSPSLSRQAELLPVYVFKLNFSAMLLLWFHFYNFTELNVT